MITASYVAERLEYNPTTGRMFWKAHKDLGSRNDLVGKEAGHIDKSTGYVVVRIKGIRYQLHRVAYLMQLGDWPQHEIDHKNLNKQDNSWDNIRHATRQINTINRGMSKNNTSGYKGVSWSKRYNKWAAYIAENKRQKHLGYFDNIEDAKKCRDLAEARIFQPILDMEI